MAKKKVIETTKRALIFSNAYNGYLDEMPEDLKAERKLRKSVKK